VVEVRTTQCESACCNRVGAFSEVQRQISCADNDWFNYWGPEQKEPVVQAALSLNNLPRMCREGAYLRLVQPLQHHSKIPEKAVYCYSFALHPELSAPSGSLNFSRIDNTQFTVHVDPSMVGETWGIIVFCRSINFLRFKEGLGGLKYSN
jgi:hypothetical protein